MEETIRKMIDVILTLDERQRVDSNKLAQLIALALIDFAKMK